MPKSAYKRARMRDITGRWPTPGGTTPGHRELLREVPQREKNYTIGSELIEHARKTKLPRSARKTRRTVPNSRRNVTSGKARFMRGRRRIIDRH